MDGGGDVFLRCVLHATGCPEDINDTVLPFNKQTWQTAKDIAKARKLLQKRSKYLLICESTNFELNEPKCYYGFHKYCYSNFTAFHAKDTDCCNSDESILSVETRSMVERPLIPSSSTGVLETRCIFCHSASRKHFSHGFENLSPCETLQAQNSIVNAAQQLQDQNFLRQFDHVDFVSKKVMYHETCKRRYLSKGTKYGIKKEFCDKQESAFPKLISYIESEVFSKRNSKRLVDVNEFYKKILKDEGFEEPTSDRYNLLSKIKEHFGSKLQVHRESKRDGIYLSIEDDSVCNDIKNVALFLREKIKKLHDNKLPNPITVEAIQEGQCSNIPSELLEFYRILYTGSKDTSNQRIERYIESSAEDDIYKTTNGTVKPSKHLLLAMGLKSITGSRKVIDIVNHFGHCIGYHTVEEFETEIAAKIIQENKILPDGLQARKGLSTNTAWDNYDESKFHDTQGICIQNQVPVESSPTSISTVPMEGATSLPSQNLSTVSSIPPSISVQKQNKRSISVPDPEFETVRKKLKISHFSFKVQTMGKPENYSICAARDIAWTVSCKTNRETPMWSGWNSTVTKDDLPVQKIGYLANIGAPPTRQDVVNETMKRNVLLAKECKEDNILTTYDLAIAKPASQLQDVMRPKFDNVFICFGAFHIMFRYLSAIGYIMDGSGATHILIESGALSKGSLNAFISAKHYNQARRMHVLLAAAMRSKHLDLFLQMQSANEGYTNLVKTLKAIQASPSPESMTALEKTEKYTTFMKAYEKFCSETRVGKYGVNAQFWRNYIDMIDIFMLFSRAVRTNDLNLFIYILGEMISVFFAANRHNYARYMCLYYLRLLNMDSTHPGIRKQLEHGGLSVRLSSNSFARQPVDQALESTINADAASRHTGITAFHQSQGATRRWTVTRSARSTIVQHLFEKAELNKNAHPCHELQKSKVVNFQNDFENISRMIEDTMNPFDIPLVEDSSLYCLADGKKMPNEVKEDMLNVIGLGNMWKEEFLQECLKDPSRFERPLQRRKAKNFASAAVKSLVQGKDEKLIEMKATRDLLGRLVYLACTREIDLEKVFSFPLTPVPLSLASIYGTMKKTPKHKLANHLEGLIKHTEPTKVDVVVYDAMFIIQSLPSDLPSNFGKVSELVLKIICRTEANIVHFVCDSYGKSIKNAEQQSRGENYGLLSITGAEQVRPKDFRQALKSQSFKTALIRFFMNEWQQNKYASILNQKTIIVAHEGQCLQYQSSSGKVECTEALEFVCSHMEADTRLVYHLSLMPSTTQVQNVVVRANDTDVMVILLYHAVKLKVHVWMDLGHSSDNSRRFLNITQLAEHLGSNICKALPGYHSITGCDYTSPFFRKGKLMPLKKMEKNPPHLVGLGSLGEEITFVDVDNLVEQYVCSLYGKEELSSVNEARVKIFQQKYKPVNSERPLEKIKGIDASMLPPCRDVLLQKIARCNYVAYLWKHAHIAHPLDNINPTDHGWKEKDGIYLPIWFSGSQMPTLLSKVMEPEDVDDEEENDDDDDDDDDCITYSDSEEENECDN